MKTAQAFQAFAIDLARRGGTLVAELARRVFERRLRVAKAIAAVGAGKLAINKDGDTGFTCTRTGIVGREDARGSRGNSESFGFGEEAKWDAKRPVLRGEERSLAVKRVDKNAAESRSRQREKMTPAHGRSVSEESSWGTWEEDAAGPVL